MKFGEYMKMERLRRDLRLADLAKMAGVSKSTLSHLENDKFHRFSTIKAVLDAMGLTVEDATAAGVEWFEAPQKEKKIPPASNYEIVIDYITASPDNEARVRRFLAYLDKLGGSNDSSME